MTTTTIITERLAKLPDLTLYSGSHDTDSEMCAMEAVAWLAGEQHSDRPACACPVVSAPVRRLNDRIGDDKTRTELILPLLPRLVGSRSTRSVQIKRAFVSADWAVRVFAPIALRARGMESAAAELEACATIVDKATAEAGGQIARKHAAAYAADAAAYAADAAAYAAAAYAARAAAYAAYAADAAAYAADAYGRRSVYVKAVEMISAMLDVTE